MSDNPYITQDSIAKIIGTTKNTIWRNINQLNGKYIRRVGSDKTGFWEIIKDAPINAPANAPLNWDNTTLTETQKTILILMSDNPYITQDEIAEIIGTAKNTIWRNIQQLNDKYIRRVGSKKTGFWEIINIPNRQN